MKSKPYTFQIELDLLEQLKQRQQDSGAPVSELIRRAIRNYLEKSAPAEEAARQEEPTPPEKRVVKTAARWKY